MRFRGEDVRAGDVLARAGERLTLPRLSALASAGVGEVAVHRRPRLHLLVTGLGAAAARRAAGAGPHPRVQRADGLACSRAAPAPRWSTAASSPDDRAATLEAVERGLAGDVLVVSGGVSVGPHDHVKPAFEACGVEEVLWRVQIKPGKPMWFGPPRRARWCSGCRATRCRASSASACSSSRRCGACRASATRARGSCAGGSPRRPRPPTGARRSSPRAIAPAADGVLEATPTERQGSHMTGALGESDGFAVAPHGAPAMQAGDAVDLLLLG